MRPGEARAVPAGTVWELGLSIHVTFPGGPASCGSARYPADVTGECSMARIEGVSKSQAGPVVKLVYRFGPRAMKKLTGRDPQTGNGIEPIQIWAHQRARSSVRRRLGPGAIRMGPAVGAGGPGRAQVRAEEREDALAGIVRRGLVVSGSGHEPSQHREQDRCLVPGAFVVVEELMPGLRVLLHVVLDPHGRQRFLQAGRRSPQRPVPAAVARDDGARSREEADRVRILGRGAVVDARYSEPAVRR